MPSSLISLASLRAKLVDAFLRMGAPQDEADIAADICLEAEVLGRQTHGVRLVGNIRREYANGSSRRRPVRIERETATSAVVDGGFHLSLYVHDLAARCARQKALEAGIAIVGVTNAGVSGALGVHAHRMSGSDVVSLILSSSPSVVVPPGSAAPLLGSNPIAIAVPRADGDPVVLDMATSEISFNGLRVAIQQGTRIPPDAAVDATGQPTTDPSAAVDGAGRGRLLPFGGHRGFGLALMIELLVTGNLSDAIGADKIQPVLAEPSHFPGLYVAYRADLLDEPGRLAARTSRLLADVGAAGARAPGEQSSRRRHETRSAGSIDVDDAYLDLLDGEG